MNRAVESQKYAVLLQYTALPPGRAKEYQTLKLQRHAGPYISDGKEHHTNILHYGPRVAILEVGKYKNSKFLGMRHIDLSSIDYLTAHFEDFLEKDRPLLLRGGSDHGHLFVVRNSNAYYCIN